jgi:DNA-binding transcriptional MerR regulator
MSELSRRADASIPTIKYYLRQGLLPSGVPTARNQADYGDEHVDRLLLIRTLTGLGRLSIATVRTVLEALDKEQGGDPGRRAAAMREASHRVARLLDDLGWQIGDERTEPAALGRLLHALGELDGDHDLDAVERYARAAANVARLERDLVEGPAAAGTVAARRTLFDAVLVTVRQLAYEANAEPS